MYAFAPIGELYIDDLKVAIFNYILSKQKNKPFVLYLDDNDKKSEEIATLLRLLGLDFQEPIYKSINLKFYRQFASKLLQEGKAFSCFCTDEIISKKQKSAKKNGKVYRYDGSCKNLSDFDVLNNENPFVIRIKKPDKTISFIDTIKGKLEFSDMDDFVIMNKNKYPTCTFANSIDDMIYNTTHIIKSEDSLQKSAKELHVRDLLGYNQEIKYTHLPTISNSKEFSLVWLLESGYLPEAIVNYLILLGISTPKEIFTLDEAMVWFDLQRVLETNEKFDINMLNKINKEHIKLLDDIKLASMIGFSSLHVGKLAKLYTQKANTLNQLKEIVEQIFTKKEYPSELENGCKILSKTIQKAPKFDRFDEFKSHILKSTNLKEDEFLKLFRVLLTDKDDGVKLEDLYKILKYNLKEIVR